MNLYPRGELFLTELPGKVEIQPGSDCALTLEDMNQHIRRGEAVRISGQWFRVSSEVRCFFICDFVISSFVHSRRRR